MPWNKYYTSTPEIVTFVLGEMSYYKCFLITYKLSGEKESYACYLDREKRVFSEHTLTEENQRKAEIGYIFFTNPKKTAKYVAETKKIIGRVTELKKEIDSMDLNGLDKKQILKLVRKAEPIYYDSLGYYFLSQPEYTAKFNESMLNELNKYIPDSKVQNNFLKLIESQRPSCLEIERSDWLKNIAIPWNSHKINKKQKDKHIDEHIKKHKYLAASSQFGLWNAAHYKKLLDDDSIKKISTLKEELKKIQEKRLLTEKIQKEIIIRYKLPPSLVKKFETVALLGWLRLEAHLRGWQFFHYLGPLLVAQAAKIIKLNREDVFNLTLSEFKLLLAGKLKIDKNIKKRRGGNILTIVSKAKGEYVYFAQEAKRKYDSEITEDIKAVSEFSGQVASGTGKISGKVFVFKWGEDDINKRRLM